MQIDWITVSAQILNFLILVWLLKKFLYKPVIQAMEAREQRIAERLEEATSREQQADAERQSFEEQNKQLLQQREQILEQAKQDAATEKRQLVEVAREEVDATRTHWQRQVEQEKDEFFSQLRHQSSQAIQATARKALGELAETELEEQMVHTFIRRLADIDEDTRQQLRETREPVCVATAFELSKTTSNQITVAIQDTFGEDVEVDFVLLPELLCGIELTSGGRRLSWNLADYLEGLSKRIEANFAPLETSD